MMNSHTEALTRETLAAKTDDDLKAIAKVLKIKFHPNVKRETLIDRISAQPQANQRDSMKHVAEQVAAPVFDNTEDEVRAAIQTQLDKGLIAKFLADGTWHFSFKGREESGNMKIPLRIIKMKAENVARGALKLRMIDVGTDGLVMSG